MNHTYAVNSQLTMPARISDLHRRPVWETLVGGHIPAHSQRMGGGRSVLISGTDSSTVLVSDTDQESRMGGWMGASDMTKTRRAEKPRGTQGPDLLRRARGALAAVRSPSSVFTHACRSDALELHWHVPGVNVLARLSSLQSSLKGHAEAVLARWHTHSELLGSSPAVAC